MPWLPSLAACDGPGMKPANVNSMDSCAASRPVADASQWVYAPPGLRTRTSSGRMPVWLENETQEDDPKATSKQPHQLHWSGRGANTQASTRDAHEGLDVFLVLADTDHVVHATSGECRQRRRCGIDGRHRGRRQSTQLCEPCNALLRRPATCHDEHILAFNSRARKHRGYPETAA